jgi:predicted dehydrogenase
MAAEVKLCMIGAGRHASRNIYPYFHFLAEEAQVTANCDLDLDKARRIGERFGIRRHFAGFREMIDQEQPDGVMVCIGAESHADLAIALMESGVHVYVEKPHAPSLERSKAMLDTAVRTRRICMAAYKKRFATAYRKARAIAESEEFGRPTYLSLLRSKGGGGEKTPAYLWEWGCHATDLVTFLSGPVVRARAAKASVGWEAVSAVLEFANGAIGSLSLCAPGGSWEEVTLLGEGAHGIKIENSIRMTRFHGDRPRDGHYPSFIHGATHSSVESGFVGELREFVAAIAEGRQPESNIAHNTHAAALHEAMMRSLETGDTEAVEQFDPGMLPVPVAAEP